MQQNDMASLEEQFDQLVQDFRLIHVEEIPDIDLYMDQVLTFLNERLAVTSRDPDNDKILTKTMINNYAKSNLMNPPVNKKYNRDHMIQLLLIFYLKSFLSIGDIEEILRPLRENYTAPGREARRKAEEEARKKAEEARRKAEKTQEEARKRAEKAQEEARRREERSQNAARPSGEKIAAAAKSSGSETTAAAKPSGEEKTSPVKPSDVQDAAAAGTPDAANKQNTDANKPGSDKNKMNPAEKSQGTPKSPAAPVELQEVYRRLTEHITEEMKTIEQEAASDFEKSAASFSDFPESEQKTLRKFDLISRMSMDIYLRKLFIERMIDQDKEKQTRK